MSEQTGSAILPGYGEHFKAVRTKRPAEAVGAGDRCLPDAICRQQARNLPGAAEAQPDVGPDAPMAEQDAWKNNAPAAVFGATMAGGKKRGISRGRNNRGF